MTVFAASRPDLSSGAYRVWQRNRDVLLRLWKSEFLAQLIEPVIVILALGIGLGQFVELESGEEYVTFLAPGLLAMFPMFSAVFECAWGSYVRLEMQGTYKAIMATPVSVDDIITGEILWGTTRSMVNGAYILLVAAVLSPWLPMVESPWAILVVPLGALPGVLFSSVSIAFASIARAMSQFSYFFNLVINPMFWFGGAFFPFAELPQWAQVLGWFIPLTHVVEMYRDLLQGTPGWGTIGHFAWLLVATALFYLVALTSMRRRLVD
ncbi:MAG: ABC transporter permease [Dehalococcoidia bacterium]|nr:ABC transporter permease [Dehalococcoidia bacterium]